MLLCRKCALSSYDTYSAYVILRACSYIELPGSQRQYKHTIVSFLFRRGQSVLVRLKYFMKVIPGCELLKRELELYATWCELKNVFMFIFVIPSGCYASALVLPN